MTSIGCLGLTHADWNAIAMMALIDAVRDVVMTNLRRTHNHSVLVEETIPVMPLKSRANSATRPSAVMYAAAAEVIFLCVHES